MREEENWIKIEKILMQLPYKKKLLIEKCIGEIANPSICKPISNSKSILEKLWDDYAENSIKRWTKLQNCYKEFYGREIFIFELKDNFKLYLTGKRKFKRTGSEALKFLSYAFQVPEEYILYGIKKEKVTDEQNHTNEIIVFHDETNARRAFIRQNDTKTAFLSLSNEHQKALKHLVENLYHADLLERWDIEIEDVL